MLTVGVPEKKTKVGSQRRCLLNYRIWRSYGIPVRCKAPGGESKRSKRVWSAGDNHGANKYLNDDVYQQVFHHLSLFVEWLHGMVASDLCIVRPLNLMT